MKIIDKHTDFYDYYQNIYSDDTFTFDRTDSFLLTKELLCQHLSVRRPYYRPRKQNKQKFQAFLLMQVCHTFWLFLVDNIQENEYEQPVDYTLELLTTWKNYHKQRVLMQLDVISFSYSYHTQLHYDYRTSGYDRDTLLQKINVLQQAIDMNDYRVLSHIDRHTVYIGDQTKVDKHIPLLKACGIAHCVDPLDVFLAFEEYFSLEKTSTERTEPLGTTDKDKVESHGFDIKTSFRKNITKKSQ